MALSPAVHAYLTTYYLIALENAPILVQDFLGTHEEDDAIWDFRTSPDRFTLREAIAHLSDWNEIFLERLNRTLKENEPMLPNCDEAQIAIDNNYAESDPIASLRRFVATRPPIVETVRKMTAQDWDRKAVREGVGPLNLGDLIGTILGHDAYHVRQIFDYTQAFEEEG